MSLLQNSYVFANLLAKPLLKCFLWFLLDSGQSNINLLYSIKLHSRQEFQFVHILVQSAS